MLKKLLLSLFLLVFMPLAAQGAEISVMDASALTSMIDQNKGKVIMLNFFATWCPPCREEMPELVKLRKEYPESEFVLLGLSVDEDKAAVEPFLKMAQVNYPVYMAPRELTDALKISSVPHNTFIGKDGEIKISEPGRAEVSVLQKVVNDLLSAK